MSLTKNKRISLNVFCFLLVLKLFIKETSNTMTLHDSIKSYFRESVTLKFICVMTRS